MMTIMLFKSSKITLGETEGSTMKTKDFNSWFLDHKEPHEKEIRKKKNKIFTN